MSRQDPGAATGQMPYALTRCTCGCLSSLHKLTDAGERAACSNSNCGCKRFAEVLACFRCTVADAVAVCCSSHMKRMCHACYRRTHFVEICVAGCTDCANESLDPTKAVTR